MKKILVLSLSIFLFLTFVQTTKAQQDGIQDSRLWFPHLRLINTLSTVAQSMFNPHPSSLKNIAPTSDKSANLENLGVVTSRVEEHQGINDPNNIQVVNQTNNNSSIFAGAEVPTGTELLGLINQEYIAAQCYMPEVVNNPGDDLIGPEIKTRLYYTSRFEYEPLPLSATPIPINLTSQVKITPIVKTPLIENIYDNLVDGSASLFKRFMPFIATQDIKEIPSTVAYAVSAQSVNGSGSLKKIATENSSSQVVYIPHVGSLKRYWLDDFQTALRPYGATSALANDSTQMSCDMTNSGIQSQLLMNEISKAADKANIPVELLVAVLRVEGCRDTNGWNADGNKSHICALTDADFDGSQNDYFNERYARNCQGSSEDGQAKGPFQFYDNPDTDWGDWKVGLQKLTGDSRATDICNIKDGIYAAALKLSAHYYPYRDQNGILQERPNDLNPEYDVSLSPNPGVWSLEDKKRALSRWALGGTTAACARGVAVDYCGFIDNLYELGFTTTCNQ